MRKTRLLTLLLLLMTAVTGAWANDYLYLEVSGESATMKYGEDYDGKPYYDERAEWWYDGYDWNGKGTIKTITVDASCQNVNYSNLSGLFFDFSGLEAINNAGNLNTSNVQDMSRIFVNCSSFTKLDLSGWDTGEVTDMLSMFDGCVSLTALNISGWNTGELTNTQGMFENCVNLKFIYVGAGWSTTKVTNDDAMFYGCENLPNWDNTTDVSKAYVGDGGYLTSNMKTIYCKMEYGWWTQDGAAIGIYAWGDNNQKNADYPGKRMTLADGETNIWKFDLDIAKYENCIFTRVNGSGDIADWGAKTQDLTIPTNDDDMFTITSSTAVWGGSGCEGTWSKYIAPKFILTGSMSNWEEKIKVYGDNYVLDLNAGKYQIKVIDNGSWKGIDDLTEVTGGLYKDQDGNICFKLDHVCDVTVSYKSGELFTVEGEFADPEIKLIGIKGWNELTDAIILTPSADQKSASATITIDDSNVDTYGRCDFRVIREGELLSKENGDENYVITKTWNWVAGLVKNYSGLKNISLQTDGVNKEYTFTYEYATDKLTVIYPGLNTITIDDGNIDAANWSAEPTEQYDGQNVTLKYKGKKKIKRITIEAASTARTAAEATAEDIGKLIGADGNIYDDAAAATAASTTAVAMIAYVGNDAETSTTYNHGLALALGDVSDTKNWCSQTEATCLGTGHQFDSEAGAKGDMAGIDNTDYLIDHAPAGHAHDAASAARGYNSGTHPAGTSAWFLPSAGQWDKMAAAAGSYANLIANAGLQGGWGAAYWSSTEGGAEYAWFFDSSQGKLDGYSKDEEFRVRACLAF